MGESPHHPAMEYTGLRLTQVAPILGTKKLYVVWKNAEEAVIDFSKTISENKWFAPLNNPAEFQTVKLAEWGTGLEWDCDADIGSDLIRHMADQQDSVLHRETRKSAA